MPKSAGSKHSPSWGWGAESGPQVPGWQVIGRKGGSGSREGEQRRGVSRGGDMSLGAPICGEGCVSRVYMCCGGRQPRQSAYFAYLTITVKTVGYSSARRRKQERTK